MDEIKPLSELYDLLSSFPDLKVKVDRVFKSGKLPDILKIQKQIGDSDAYFVLYESYSTAGYVPKTGE